MFKKLFKKSKQVMPVSGVESMTMEDIKQRLEIQRTPLEDSQGSSFMDDIMSSFDTIQISSLDIQQVTAKENVQIRQEESKSIVSIPQQDFSSYNNFFDEILSQSNTSSDQPSIKTSPSFIRDEKGAEITRKKPSKDSLNAGEERLKSSPSKESLVPRRIPAQNQSELPAQVAIKRKKERTSNKKSSTMNVVNRRPGKISDYQPEVTAEPDSDDEPLGNRIPLKKSEVDSREYSKIQISKKDTKIQINEKEFPKAMAPVQLSNVAIAPVQLSNVAIAPVQLSNVAMSLPELPPMMLSPEQQQQMLMMYYIQISLMQQTTQMQGHLKESLPEFSKSNRKRPIRPKTQVFEKQNEKESVKNDDSTVLSDEKEVIEAQDSAVEDSNIISTSHNDDS